MIGGGGSAPIAKKDLLLGHQHYRTNITTKDKVVDNKAGDGRHTPKNCHENVGGEWIWRMIHRHRRSQMDRRRVSEVTLMIHCRTNTTIVGDNMVDRGKVEILL